MTNLSICIIAKNEEVFIENCLKSVKDIAGEIIVLDTGSNDRTIEIAKEYAKVYQGTWENDFSKSRNECISYATGDWILILDADEVLTEETQKEIIPFIEENKNKFATNVIFGFKNIHDSLNDHEIKYHGYKHSLFRNNLGIKFKHKVHEHLYHPDFSIITLNLNNLVIKHNDQLKSPDYINSKNKKYSYILLDLINNFSNETPGSGMFDLIYYWFQLGNTYNYLKEYKKALNSYRQALGFFEPEIIKTNESIYLNILSSFFQPLCEMKEYLDALTYIEQFNTFLPDFPDAVYYKAFCNQNLGNIQLAVTLYQEAFELIKEKKFINIYSVKSLENTLQYLVLNELSKCYLILGQKEKSFEIVRYLHSKLPESIPITVNIIKNLVLNDNLGDIYNINNMNSVSFIEKDKLKEIIKLDKMDFRYKNYQVKLLEKILKLDGIIPEERIIIFQKIDSLLS